MNELDFSNPTMIIHCNPSWNHADWLVEFVKISDKNHFVNLWLKDGHDGYLAQWKHCKTSPVFSTKKAAEEYALENWNQKEVL